MKMEKTYGRNNHFQRTINTTCPFHVEAVLCNTAEQVASQLPWKEATS
jgi:hypothetical protein